MNTLLSINNYYYYRGGAETVFLEHNRMFERLGWRVVPFAMRHPENLQTDWARYFIDEIEFGHHYSLAGRIARVPKIIYSSESRRQVRALVRDTHPNIAHAHNVYHHLSPSVLAALKRRGVPVVLTLHDLKLACPEAHMLTHDGICERCRGGRLHNVVVHRCIKGSRMLSGVVWLEALVNRVLRSYQKSVDCFVVPSRFYMDKLRDWGVLGDNAVHVPNFIDPDVYVPGWAPSDTFVYFGRLSKEKGVATLVRGAARAGVKLRVIGTGPEEPALRALAVDLGADVEFAGYHSGEALRARVRECRAVVLPSEWYENAPMSVLEAYALGKPVIGARIGGIPELVREGETGAVFDSGSVSALADTLCDWAAYPHEQIVSAGMAGRAWVEDEFSLRRYEQRMQNIYHDLGARGPEQSP